MSAETGKAPKNAECTRGNAMIRTWHKGDKPERTYSQEIRNMSSAGRELAEAIRRNLYLKRLAIEARKETP